MSITKKKRRLAASLMALALAAMPGGMSPMATVNAEETSESSTEKVQLDTPTNLRWGPPSDEYYKHFTYYDNGKYFVNWEGVNSGAHEETTDGVYTYWGVEIYKDEQLFHGYSYQDGVYEYSWENHAYTDIPKTKHSWGIKSLIFESGSYKFRVRAEAMYDDETYRDSEWSEWSESITYVRPERELGVVANATWDAEKAGLCHFIPSEISGDEYLEFFWAQLYVQRPDSTSYFDCGAHLIGAYECKDGEVVDVDFSDDISRYGEGKYYVTVQAFSMDIDTVAHGRESEPSEILDTSVNAEKLSGILSAAAGKSAVETTELLTGSADISAIQQAMQTDDTFRRQIQELESRYAQEQGIEVKPPAVSDTVKEYVDPNHISMVGAAFNAAQGQAVNLQMDVTPDEKRVPVFSGYKKNVQLDIKLVGDNTEIHDLSMPVTVTMPIPQGISAAQLVILHHHADGTTEKTAFHVNGDGTITFTVTSFSTFVFAEKGSEDVPGQSEPSEPVPGQPASNPGQSASDSGSDWFVPLKSRIAAAAPGSIVRVTKDQGIDTLSNDVMQMLVKRGDVALEMEYDYQGTDYHIFIPAGRAVDNDIPWYGPLYLSAYFSAAGTVSDNGGTYVVQKGDTLSEIAHAHHTTVARLAAANPQIRDINRIVTGQVINID